MYSFEFFVVVNMHVSSRFGKMIVWTPLSIVTCGRLSILYLTYDVQQFHQLHNNLNIFWLLESCKYSASGGCSSLAWYFFVLQYETLMVDFLFLNTCKTFPFRTCLHATIIFSKDLEQIFPSRRSVWLHRNTATWTRAFHQWNCSVFFTGEKTSFSLSLFWLFPCTCRFATQQNVSRENSHQHYHALSLLRQDLFLHDRFLSP